MAQIIITVVGLIAGLLFLLTGGSAGLFADVERTLLWVGFALAGVLVAWLIEALTAVCLHAFHRTSQIPLKPNLLMVLIGQLCGMVLGALSSMGVNGFNAPQLAVGLAMGSIIGTVTIFYIQR